METDLVDRKRRKINFVMLRKRRRLSYPTHILSLYLCQPTQPYLHFKYLDALKAARPSSVTNDGTFQLAGCWQRVQKFPLRLYLHLINAPHSSDMTRSRSLGSAFRLSSWNWSLVFFFRHTAGSCKFGSAMILLNFGSAQEKMYRGKLVYPNWSFLYSSNIPGYNPAARLLAAIRVITSSCSYRIKTFCRSGT